MKTTYEDILAICNAAASSAAADCLQDMLTECSNEVLEEVFAEVEGGYLLEDGYQLERIIEGELEFRRAKQLVSEHEALVS